ncbi:Zinc-binding oxidoreductase [Abeliophyllum distichum]|uniref:Zinc-binding oxidoreductase n=1 Tax=Abeliophyllum distichum TaxID=126358 RepID=A0ABD1UES8_9LAMI
MGRPPGHGGPCFRFNAAEVSEMEAILQAHNCAVPEREILETLAQKFSASAERSGQVEISVKQVWNWFQNRRYALRAKATKTPTAGKLSISPTHRDDPTTVRTAPQPAPSSIVRSMPQVPHSLPAPSGRNASDNSQMEFEAKSARDGAWYDVSTFLSHRSLETSDPEVLVRFAGFGPEEDEWVNVRRHVRQRSLPCESSECVAVLPGDLILCFQEGKEQALYFDAQVLDAQRRRHDVRGCRCRFLVRYDHDQAEEIVPLRKICRRPETEYRLQELHAGSASAGNPQIGGGTVGMPQKQLMPEGAGGTGATSASVPPTYVSEPDESEAPFIISQIDSNPSQSKLAMANSTAMNTFSGGSGPNAARCNCIIEDAVAIAEEKRSSEQCCCPRFGGPEVLELRDNVKVPDLKSNEVLVRARAVSINPLDTRMRSGYGRSLFEPLLPLILGRDISGEVAAVGGSVRSFIVGQEVFGALHPTAVRGTYTDYAVLAEDELTSKPASISHVEASAIPFAALTAWRALRSTARIKKGATGISCGWWRSSGAEQAVDYTTEDYEVAIKGYFDAVLDTIGVPETERLGINLLKRGGHYMTLQGEAASFTDRYGLAIGLPLATTTLLKKQIQYRYSHGIEYWWTYMRADAEGLDEIRRLSEAGKLKIPVEKTFPITQVREAHEAKDKRLIQGKVVLDLDELKPTVHEPDAISSTRVSVNWRALISTWMVVATSCGP